jgi:hypothetical protein
VSAWARLTDKSADRTILTRDATGYGSLYFQYQASTDRWLAQMPTATSGDIVWQNAESSEPAKTGVWTHLAAVYDAELKSLTLYVNGLADTSVEELTTFNEFTRPTLIGRSWSTWFAGDIADVRVWNRATNEAEIAEYSEPRLMANWQFEDDSDPTIARDSSFEKNHGSLTGGAAYTYPGYNDFGDVAAVHLDGVAAHVTSPALLRTDQSFSVSTWARLTGETWNHTALSQDGEHSARFMLQRGNECKCWRFMMMETDTALPGVAVAEATTPAQVNTWTHLAATFDANTNKIQLYVGGELAGEGQLSGTPWHAAGPFTAGRTRWDDHVSDFFPGDLDAIRVYQGVISPETVKELSTL